MYVLNKIQLCLDGNMFHFTHNLGFEYAMVSHEQLFFSSGNQKIVHQNKITSSHKILIGP